ncbi:MAG: flagellar hook protein FlgE [Acidimicrobiales bacterium]|nr:flagellar hook protein FlgE [Acidimicrobiales bacterium]
MMRSMFAGVSGVRSHQTMTDVVANNIANVNTVGFKVSRAQFADTLSQQLRGAAGSGEATAGINPQQVGLGVKVASTNMSFAQGGMQLTGRATDVAIQGDGFFIMGLGAQRLYTRAGSFSFDDDGQLTDPLGGAVMGWNVDQTGTININGPIEPLRVPVNATIPPVATTSVRLGGNLNADAAIGTQQSTAIDIVDNLGAVHRITFDFMKTADNAWTMSAIDPNGATIGTSNLVFDPASGDITSPANPTLSYTPAGTTAVNFEVDWGPVGTSEALTQYGGVADAQAMEQNGTEVGFLRSFAISDDGSLSGVFSNGETQTLGQLALATFANPSGLLSAGDSRFRGSNASGQALLGVPNTAGRGTIAAGALEMSNADLSEEFTQLIVAQRGFQANSRIITVSDEMIQELVNLKR